MDTPNRECRDCRRQFEVNDVLTNALPPTPGEWHHTDCGDPKLSQGDMRRWIIGE